jgi:RNA-directed DNA polymerase
MLTRLTSRESANRVWFTLLDKTDALAHLRRAVEKVWRKGGSAGAEGQTVAHFARHAETELQGLHEQLRDGSYRPQPVRRAWIAKLGSQAKRPLGIPAVRERIVPGALRQVDTLLHVGHHWVVDADLKSYFDTIPHARLLALVKARVADG